jgi:serine/threonine-protein kinase
VALTPGTRLGAYEILAPLGAGGMGEVYRARDTRLDRSVAIKVMPPEVTTDPQFRARFDREARAISQLQHPHICTLHDVGEVDGTAFLVMELLQGQTLADRLKKGALPLDEALKIAIDVADALTAAHKQGIVHRDLKPANIVLTKSGAKLLDFGLARSTGPVVSLGVSSTQQTGTTHLTGSGTILGTLHYMSPEQVEGREVDGRSDIWALGVVIYEMATGARPFQGDSGASVVGAILKDTPPAISEKQTLSPPSLDHLVERCLEKDPDDRWQTVSDVRRELTWIGRNTATGTNRSGSSLRPRSNVAKVVAWALLAALIAVVIFDSFRLRISSRPVSVIKLDLNMPSGVELGSTNFPTLSLSQDGATLAFVGGMGGLRRIFVRRFDESNARALQGTETANICFMAPDGRSVGFISSDGILKKISVRDGLVTTIVSGADYNGGGGAWGSDDRIVFVRSGELWDVSAAGGAPRQLTRIDRSKREALHSWPTVLPGGSVILFTVVTAEPRTRMHIEALTRPSGERRTVVDNGSVPQMAASGHLLFFRDDSLLATPFDLKTLTATGQATSVLENIAHDQLGEPIVALSDTGVLAYAPVSSTKHLVWVSRQGVEEPVNDTPRAYQNPRLAPDGHRIVVEVGGGDLWIQDVSRATFTRLTTGETIGNTFAVWTPDGRRVVFRTVTGLWSLDTVRGGGLKNIPNTTVIDVPTSISPDGKTMALIRRVSETADIYAVPLDGSAEPAPIIATPGYDGGAIFSPNGQWLAYVSTESGPFEVYVSPYPALDRKLPVSTHGGTHPRWNPNGRELFYRSGNTMMVVDVSTRGGDILLSQPRVLFEQRYAFGSAQTVPNYDVTPDGQRFVMVKDDSDAGRLNIVLNWFEELKTRAPLR